MTTPALLVPATPEGRLYSQFHTIAAGLARAVLDRLQTQPANVPGFENVLDAANGTRLGDYAEDYLGRLLADYLHSIPLAQVQAWGVAETLRRLQALAIFTWDTNAPREQLRIWVDVKDRYQEVALPAIARGDGFYSIHPAFAAAYLGAAVDKAGAFGFINDAGGRCFAAYREGVGVVFSQGVIDAMRGSLELMVHVMQYGTPFAQAFDQWWNDPTFYTFTEIFIDEVQEGATVPVLAGMDAVLKPGFSLSTASPWVCQAANHPVVLVKPLADLGKQLNDARAKADRAQLLQAIAIFGALVGGGIALQSIATSGASFANVAQLVGSVDNLPGVDLGAAGKIASGYSQGVKLAAQIPGADTMFDFPSDLDVFDPESFDIDLTLDDIGAGAIDFDFSILDDYGLEATDLLPDDFGNVFTVTGEAVVLEPEAYVKSIYVDSAGNYRDFSNQVLLSQGEAEQVFNESGADNDAVFQALANKVFSLQGQTFDALAGDVARPAGTPQPAGKTEVPLFTQISQEVLNWFKSITSYSLAKEQLEKTGRFTPPYATSSTGMNYSQVPGMPIQRADGSTVVNNGNGTQTIRYANGQTQTVPTSLAGSSFAGGQIIPGVSNQTLLLAGAGLLAVALLARRS